MGFEVTSATKWQCMSVKLVQKEQQHSILFRGHSHLTFYIYLFVYFASTWYITKDNLRHCLGTSLSEV